MKCSICIATFNHSRLLVHTLDSIYRQQPRFPFEVIVVDDGSATSDAWLVCSQYPALRYVRIDREPTYRNPSRARNVAYKAARGEIIVAQSDDVVHHSHDCLQRLADELKPGTFVIASVTNVDGLSRPYRDPNGRGYGDRLKVYTGPANRRPLFFLGSLYRHDLYCAGGNDEEFADPSGEDQWFALCLTRGLGLRPIYSSSIVGHHQHHNHTQDYTAVARSQAVLKLKIDQAQRGAIPWRSSAGQWSMDCPSTESRDQRSTGVSYPSERKAPTV